MRLGPDEMIFWQHGFFKLNGTIVFTWGLMLVLAVGSKLITRNLSTDLKRSRWQNLLEIVVTGVEKQIEDVGLRHPKKYKALWHDLYRSITNLVRHLHENGTRIVKFYLHLSKEEQRKRLLERIDEPEKNWKFSLADIKERNSSLILEAVHDGV
jgi:Polyphosphate kinase 2 (PPK2)